MITKLAPLSLAALLSLGIAGESKAQDFFGFSFSKHKKNKHVGFSIGVGRDGFHFGARVHKGRRGPARRAHVHTSCCGRRWVPGCVRVVYEKVWVPPQTRRIWVPARHRWVRGPCGTRRRVLVRPGFYKCVTEPGCWKKVPRRVRTPGHWEYTCGY